MERVLSVRKGKVRVSRQGYGRTESGMRAQQKLLQKEEGGEGLGLEEKYFLLSL